MLDNTQDQNQEQEEITPVISQGLTSNAEPPIPPSGADPNATSTNMFGQTIDDLNPPRLTSTKGVYDDLMQRYPMGDVNKPSQDTDWDNMMKESNQKLAKLYKDNEERNKGVDLNPSNIRINDLYTTLSDGTLSRKYDDFLVGVDNEERLAQNQSTASKWGNGLAKFVGKTATNVIGGTIGTLVSIPQAISEGSFSALYDNDFQNSLDDLNTIMDNKLSNYYSKDEQDMNFFQKLGTANFYANDLTNGLSFLVGAAVSEGIWAAATGGASLAVTAGKYATKMPKFMKSALALHKGVGRKLFAKTLTKEAKNEAIKASNWAKAGNTLRFAMTSAGYESGVEARHYLNQAQSNFLQQYALDNNGATPSAEEMSTFMDDATNSANALFGFNMALVGGSNVMTLGKLFGVMPKSSKAMTTGAKGYLNKKLFGLGVKGTAEEGFEKIGRKKFQKLALGGYSKLKTPFREGFIEEGLQATASNAAENWLESRYSSQAQDKNISIMKSFYEGLSHTYGTKEGWNEIGIGMLIGALGGAVNGEFSSGKDAVKNLDSEIDTRNRTQTQEYALRLFKTRMENSAQMASINEEIDQASSSNETAKQQDATMRLLTTKVDLDYDLGDQNASFENLSMLMDSMTDQQISDSTGVEVEQVAEYKKEILEQFKDVQKKQIKNREYADAIFGDAIQDKGNDIDTNAVKKALAFTLTMGENSYDTANLMLSEAQALIGDSTLNSVLDTYNYITGLDKESLKSLNTIKDKLKVVDEKLSEVDKQLGYDITDNRIDVDKAFTERLNVGNQNKQNEKRDARELAKLNKLIDQKNKLEKQKAQLSDDLQDVNVSMNAKNSFGSQIATGIDNNTALGVTLDMLRDMDTDINKLNKILSKMSKSDPQRASQITKLLKEYGVAKNNLKKYNDITQQIVTGDYTVTTKSMFNKKKLDAQTRSLIDKLQKEAVLLSASMASDTSTITQEEYNTWKETSELTPELIRKVMAQKETGILSKKERSIYEKHKEEIDKAIEAKKSKEGDSMVDKDPDTQTTTETSPKTVRDKLIARINKALGKNSAIQYVGIEDVQESKRPTKEEIDRYKFLKKEFRKKGTPHNKIIRKENPEEGIEQEFQKLNTKLANWRMVDSAVDENGTPLKTLVDRLELLEQEQQEEEIASEATEEDIIKETSSIQDGNTNNNDKSVTQVQETVVVKHENYDKRKDLVISHLKLENILNKLPEESVIKFFNDKGKTVKSLDGASRVSIKIGANSFNIELLSRGRMKMSQDDFNNLPVPYRTLKPYSLGGSWSDLYQVMKNGVLKIVESDFKLGTSSLTKLFKFDFKTLSETKVGDELDIVLDFRTDYNTNQLKAEYEAGKITVDDVVRNVQIFLKRKDGIVSMLKASEEDNNDNPTHTMIRESFREQIVKFLENDPSVVNSEVKSDIRVPVKKVWIGRPKLSARLNENNQAVLEFKDITKKGADRIVDYGFVDSEGNFELKNGVSLEKGTYRDMTINARKNQSKKIPIIIISEGKNKLIMRVNLKKTTLDFTEQVEEIERSKINREEKANELLGLAANNGLDANNYITEEYIDVNKLLEDLNDLEFFPSTDSWLSDKSHNKFSLVGEITVPLDLDESVMTASKLQIDLDVAEERMSGNMGQQSMSDVAIEVENLTKRRDDLIKAYDDNVSRVKESEISDEIVSIKDSRTYLEKAKDEAEFGKKLAELEFQEGLRKIGVDPLTQQQAQDNVDVNNIDYVDPTLYNENVNQTNEGTEFINVYRAEGKVVDKDDLPLAVRGNAGSWFTPSKTEVARYAAMNNRTVYKIAIPKALYDNLLKSREGGVAMSKGEIQLPQNISSLKTEVSQQTQEDVGTPVNEDVFLTEQDINELMSFAVGSDNFKTLDDIRVALGAREDKRSGLFFKDRIVITKQTLRGSGLFNTLEINRIMSSQGNIDALEGLINRLAMDMDSSFDLSGVDNSFAVYSTTEFTTLGTAKVVNDIFEAKNNFFKSTVGMNQDKFTEEVLKSEFENLRKKFEQEGSEDFQNALYNESRKYVLVEKIDQSKEVMDSMLNIPESQDQELEESLLFINTMTEDTWESNNEDVKEFLSNIQDMMLRNYSLVLPNLSELYDTSTMMDIQNMLTNIKGILDTLPEDTSTQIQNEINKVTGEVSSEIGSTTEVIRLEDDKAEELRDRTLVSMVTDKSIYETFKESGLVYVAKGIYQRVTKSNSLEDMYKSFLDKRNIEGVKTIEDLKEYIQSKRSELDIPEGIDVDESLAEMLTLYTEFYNNPYTKNNDVYTMDKNDMSQELVSSLQDINYGYLENDFPSDFMKSNKNDNLDQILNFMPDGKGGIVIEVKQGVDANFFRSVLESNKQSLGEDVYNNLVNYLMLSKTKNPINTNVESMIFESENSEALQRDIYINNPNKLDKFTKDADKPNNDVAVVEDKDLKSGENFIRLDDNNVYERVDQRGSKIFFAKLPNMKGSNINVFGMFPRPSLKGVDIEDYSAEGVGKPNVKPNENSDACK